jgi:autotransporter strand-loop-strand O-heptosyltransferase
MNTFEVSYVTTQPKNGDAPMVSIYGDIEELYRVDFQDINGKILSSGNCKTNQRIIANIRQWYVKWHILVYDSANNLVYQDIFNPTGKTVFIKMDAFALGDSIAWIPYVEEFRIKHNCQVICSTFHNNLFVKTYPKILFVAPNTVIQNVYAQYYIGAINEPNYIYAPFMSKVGNLQYLAAKTLGLEMGEIRPPLENGFKYLKPSSGKYVTLSEFGSTSEKEWKAINGWQSIVDLLNSKGYRVVVISKEPTSLKNVVDKTGNIPIEERISDIKGAQFHLGISSGLSWLAWSLGKKVVMISDVTPVWHEFNSNLVRFGGENLNEVNYLIDTQTQVEKVLNSLILLVSE